MEFIGKDSRQGGLDTVQNHHTVEDVRNIRDAVTKSKVLVRVNPVFYRPAEVELLVGDSSKARDQLGWSPATSLAELCQLMVQADLQREQQTSQFVCES